MSDWRERLMSQVGRLGREKAGIRQGIVTSTSPLEVSIGGSDVSVSAVALDGAQLFVGERVTLLVQDKQFIVLGRNTNDPTDAGDLGFGFNVKYFGAKGDGVTDDTDAIQAAMSEAWDRARGVVYFPPGTYLVTGLSIPVSRLTLQGENAASFNEGATTRRSVLKLAAGSNAPLIHLPSIARNTTLRGLMLDANGSNQSSGDTHGIYAPDMDDSGSQDTHLYVQQCYITRCRTDGIRMGWQRGGLRVFQCHVYDCGGHGINLEYADHSVVNTGIGDCGLDGIYADSWTTKISTCDIWDCRNGVNFGPVSRLCSLTNSMLDRHQSSGVYCSGKVNTIVGNAFHKNSQSGDSDYPHLNMSGESCSVTANTFNPAAGGNPPPRPNYDIYVGAGLECCVVGNIGMSGSSNLGHLGLASGATALINQGQPW